MLVAHRLGALEEGEFRLLWLGQATSSFGSSLVPVALAFAVIGLTGSKTALGLVLSAGLVSRVILLLLGGVVADRLQRRRVMLAADLLRAGTQGLVAVLLLSGEARVWHLLALFALFGAGDAFFSPASTGLVPETVSPGRLQQANALMSLSRSTAWVVGPALAGLIVAAAGPGWAFAIDSATFAVSSLSLALLRPSRNVTFGPRAGVLVELRDGWREVRSRAWVWVTIARFSISNLAIAPLFVLGPFVAQHSLGGAKAWGLIATCSGIGAVAGDAAALRLRPRRPLVAGGLAVSLWALEPALLARPFPIWAIAASAVLGFAGMSFSNALWFTALQQRIPREALSRVSSYDWLGSLVFQPAGFALAGLTAAAIGTSATLLAAAAVQAAACIGVALTPAVRGLRAGDYPELSSEESPRRARS
jgi:MFS family permease